MYIIELDGVLSLCVNLEQSRIQTAELQRAINKIESKTSTGRQQLFYKIRLLKQIWFVS